MITITRAETISYSRRYEFSSEAAPNYRNTKEITVAVNAVDITNQSGVVAGISDLILLRESSDYQPFSINGVVYNTCKLLNFETVDGDWVNLVRVNLSFSIYEQGQDALTIAGQYQDLMAAHWQIFNSITESVEIGRGIDSTSYTRTLNASMNRSANLELPTDATKGTGEINIARNVIRAIMNRDITSGYTYDEYAVEPEITDAISTSNFKKYRRETYNEIENTVSITETLNTTNVKSDEYGHNYSIEVFVTEDGVITASEKGRVEGLLNDKYSSASSWISTVLTAAKTRVKSTVDSYFTYTIGLNESAGAPVVVEESKTHNIYEGWIEYSITFSNDPNIKDGHSYGLEINKEGCYTYAIENGRFFSLDDDTQSIEYRHGVSYTNYLDAVSTINTRIKTYVSCTMTEPYAKTLSHDFIVGAVEYSHSFTDNPVYDNGLTVDSTRVKKYEISKTVNQAVNQNSTVPVLGKRDQVTQILDNLTESDASYSVNMLLARIPIASDVVKLPYAVNKAKDKINEDLTAESIDPTNRLKSASHEWAPYNDVTFKLDLALSTAEEC